MVLAVLCGLGASVAQVTEALSCMPEVSVGVGVQDGGWFAELSTVLVGTLPV